jgi:hypothetical protein
MDTNQSADSISDARKTENFLGRGVSRASRAACEVSHGCLGVLKLLLSNLTALPSYYHDFHAAESREKR